jgi:predicted cation transporter
MLFRSLSELYTIPLVVIALAMSLGRAFVLRKELWFDRKMASALKEIPLNVVLTTIIVVLGLLAILITPILTLFALGVIAFFLPLDCRVTTRKFIILGSLSTAFGSLTTVDLPLSPITSLRLEGSPFVVTFLAMLDLHTIIGMAAIGILSLFILRTDYRSFGFGLQS